jgi:hypothetical protein
MQGSAHGIDRTAISTGVGAPARALGLIFLRCADHRFSAAEKELSKTASSRRSVSSC